MTRFKAKLRWHLGNSVRPVAWKLTLTALLLGAEARAVSETGWVVRRWGTEDGLPQNTVNAIVQTRQGYLWLGTRDGLARFDGVSFKVFGLEHGLQSVDIQSLLEDREGTLWVGSYGGGLARLRDGRIEVVSAANRRAGSDIVTALAEDSAGRLWVGTHAGLRFLQPGRLVEDDALGELSRTPVRALLRDQRGSMWISTTTHGLFEWCEGKVTFSPGPLTDPRIIAHCLLQDRRGWLWASIGNGMVLCRQEGGWQVFNETHGLPFAYISCLTEDTEGTIWAGSLDDGLYYFDGVRFCGVRQKDGLSANDIRSLLLDRESNLWVGTRTGGLNRVNRRRLLYCGAAQGLMNDFTRSVAQTADGEFWVATTGGGIYRGDRGGLLPFQPEPVGGYYAHVESVLATSDGSVWWGGANGLLRWKHDRLIACVTNELWVQASSVTALQEDGRDGLWIGTLQGRLIHYHDGGFEEFAGQVARGPITALAVQPDGKVWVGSVGGGLRRIPTDASPILTVTNGLVSQSILTLRLDSEGTLWIGTAGGGLSCRRGDFTRTFTESQGISARTVSQIVEDDYGHLWLGTGRGIVKARKRDLLECAAGRIPFVYTRVYGVNDGMPAEECSGGFCPAGLKTHEGLVCFSTVKGLVFLNPREPSPSAAAPEVLIEDVLVNGQPQTIRNWKAQSLVPTLPPADRQLLIPPGGRSIEVQYTSIQFRSPERVAFRHRLDGVDESWVEAGGRRTANYQSLTPGDYLFRVQACNPEGVWSKNETALAITVQPFVYETAWFRAGVTMAGAGVVACVLWLILLRRYRNRLARLQTQHAIERERLRISQDMHDHIGGMLTQVSQLSDLGQGDTQESLLTKGRFARIGNQARRAVQALDEIVWATNPRNDNLASFAEYVSRFSDEFFECANVRCWQEVPTALPSLPLRAEVRHNVFLALREAFNNVLKHSRATEVWLRLSLADSEVTLEVEDNGYGFNQDPGAQHGDGLANMKSRLVECGGSAEIVSTPEHGTRVRFSFPRPTPKAKDI